MSKPTWEMIVPVISTAHVPNIDFIEQIVDVLRDCDHDSDAILLETNGGCMLYMGIEKSAWPEWFRPVADWFESEYPGEFWLRVDQDGDIVEELPQYGW